LFSSSHASFSSFVTQLPPPPRSTLFPYTTLFRSDELTVYDRFGGVVWTRNPFGVGPTHDDLASAVVVEIGHGEGASLADTEGVPDRKSTRLNSSHEWISYAVFCLKKKKYDQRRHI